MIVCEGAETERRYFKAFPVTSMKVVVEGLGANTLTVVERAMELRNAAKRGREPFKEVWCVFDRDSFPKAKVNDAVALCGREKIGVAWSNESFELWFLLHFHYCDAATSRESYRARLSDCLGRPYAKNAPDMYDLLLPHVDTAIRNAETLATRQAGKLPADANPMTTVGELVALLRQHSRK